MTPFIWHRLPGRLSTQPGTILVTVLAVLTMLATILLIASTIGIMRYRRHVRDRNVLVASNLAEAGLVRGLSVFNATQSLPPPFVDTLANGGKFRYVVSAWGPYAMIRSEGNYADQTAVMTALIGSSPPPLTRAAITVTDISLPLVVTGTARIRGDVNVGCLGLTTGHIGGEPVADPYYHVGEVRIHHSITVPLLDTTVLRRYRLDMLHRRSAATRRLAGSQVLDSSSSRLLQANSSYIIENAAQFNGLRFTSYWAITSVFVNGQVDIRGSSKMAGLIEITSERSIRVRDQALLDGVILNSGDSIVFEGASRFSGIAISDEMIVVKDSSRIEYPSLLFVTGRETNGGLGSGISLNSMVSLETLCYLGGGISRDAIDASRVCQDSASHLLGMVISQGECDLRGSVSGSVVTVRFSYNQPPTRYVNWLKDLHIDRTSLSYSPAIPMLRSDTLPQAYRIIRLKSSVL